MTANELIALLSNLDEDRKDLPLMLWVDGERYELQDEVDDSIAEFVELNAKTD